MAKSETCLAERWNCLCSLKPFSYEKLHSGKKGVSYLELFGKKNWPNLSARMIIIISREANGKIKTMPGTQVTLLMWFKAIFLQKIPQRQERCQLFVVIRQEKLAKFECQNDHHYMPGGKWQNHNHAWRTAKIPYGVLSHFLAKNNCLKQTS